MWRKWVAWIVSVAKLCFWFVVSKKEYRMAKATMELEAACDAFGRAIRRNGEMQFATRAKLIAFQSRLDAISQHLELQLANIGNALALKNQKRGRSGCAVEELVDKLSQEDRDLLSEAELLAMRIRVTRKHEESLQHIECRLQESNEKCTNHYASIGLANHVGDLAKIIDKIKIDGLTHIFEQLAVDVDKLVSGANEVQDLVDVEARELNEVFAGLHKNNRSVDRNEFVSGLLARGRAIAS